MRKYQLLKPVLILIFTLGALFLTGMLLTSQVASQNTEPTETPTAYWMVFPPVKRAFFETQEARRIEALKSPEPPPPPTFPPETDEPRTLVKNGEKAGAGVLFVGGPPPIPGMAFNIGSTEWEYQEGDQIYVLWAGVENDEAGLATDQGVVVLLTMPIDPTKEIGPMEIFRSPGKSGKLKIVGADGKKLKLKSDKGKKLKFDMDTRQFEQDP